MQGDGEDDRSDLDDDGEDDDGDRDDDEGGLIPAFE